jgi:hypothetical protein
MDENTSDVDKLIKSDLKKLINVFHYPRGLKVGNMKIKELRILAKYLLSNGLKRSERKKMPKTYGAGFGDILGGIKTDWNNMSRNTLNKYGDWTVIQVQGFKNPIVKALDTAMNLLSLGKWSNAKDKMQYDKFYHLGLNLKLEKDGKTADVRIEKNETVDLQSGWINAQQTIDIPLRNKSFTLNEFVNRPLMKYGKDKFFRYDPFHNNCQDFVSLLLINAGIATMPIQNWVKQPLQDMIKRLPKYLPLVSRAVTDLGAKISGIIGKGKGEESDCCCECHSDKYGSGVKPLKTIRNK